MCPDERGSLYAADQRDALPAEAVAASLGCGNPGAVADDTLTPEQRAERGDYVGCIAGALSFAEYRRGLEAAGLADIEITPTRQVADGMHSAIVRAARPVAAQPLANTVTAQADSAGGCIC